MRREAATPKRKGMRPFWALILALGFACLGSVACGGGSDGTPGPRGKTVESHYTSHETGIGYGLTIYLPIGYDKSAATYPVIYAMDGDYRFEPLTRVLNQREIPAILVGIDHNGADRRWVDFTMPGAAAYFRFLTQELIPFLEPQFRVNPAQRLLSGHSLSGNLAMYALFQEDPANRYFSAILAGDGAFWYQTAELSAADQAYAEGTDQMPIRLMMAGSPGANWPYVLALSNEIGARNYVGLQMLVRQYALDHLGMDAPSFSDGLSFVLGL